MSKDCAPGTNPMAEELLAFQDLARRKALTRSRKLPPILSVVFYTGEQRWRAPTSLLDLVETLPDAPEDLDLWSYRLIDAQRYPLAKLVRAESPLSGLFQLEQLGDAGELSGIGRELRAVLAEDEELAKAFVELINESILPRLTPPGGQRLRITALEELPTMLEQRIEKITQRWEMRGWEKGRAEGRLAGEAEILVLLVEKKLGPLPDWARTRIAAADAEQLLVWAERVLTAGTLEEIFD